MYHMGLKLLGVSFHGYRMKRLKLVQQKWCCLQGPCYAEISILTNEISIVGQIESPNVAWS